jgi:dTDP-glucose pyrophosphorylase
MDNGGISFCACVDKLEKVIGIITDGDFRRAIHSGIQLDECVKLIMNSNYYYVEKNFDSEEVKKIFNNTIIEQLPVLDNGKLIDIIGSEDFFASIKKVKSKRSLVLPVVIMAGGKGKRLDPFTRILPKPLIPFGNEPIIKVIMNKFEKFGVNKFYISVNEKKEMIKAYFHSEANNSKIKYIEENKPLGTAGALKYLEGEIETSFFVSNCDILINTNYSSVYKFHKKNSNHLTLVGSMQQYTIPYGVCDFDDDGNFIQIREKPDYDFMVSTGLYLLEPEILSLIPRDKYFDMTDLTEKLKKNKYKIGVFPVSHNSWIDQGQWKEDYNG